MVNYEHGWIEEWYIYNLYILLSCEPSYQNQPCLNLTFKISTHWSLGTFFALRGKDILWYICRRFLRTGETLHGPPGMGRSISYRLVANISPQLGDQRGYAGGFRSPSRVGVLTPQELANGPPGLPPPGSQLNIYRQSTCWSSLDGGWKAGPFQMGLGHLRERDTDSSQLRSHEAGRGGEPHRCFGGRTSDCVFFAFRERSCNWSPEEKQVQVVRNGLSCYSPE